MWGGWTFLQRTYSEDSFWVVDQRKCNQVRGDFFFLNLLCKNTRSWIQVNRSGRVGCWIGFEEMGMADVMLLTWQGGMWNGAHEVCEWAIVRGSDDHDLNRRMGACPCFDGADFGGREQIGCLSFDWWCHFLELVTGRGRFEIWCTVTRVVHGGDSKKFGLRVEAHVDVEFDRET